MTERCVTGSLPGMRQAFLQVLREGHRLLGYIQGDLRFRNAQDRLLAFQSLAAEYQVEPSIRVCKGRRKMH